ncbi:hypothetical protein [Chryseobacterium defluvii]|nr:hypothetical protein [Chryseobacterium defluvii]
MKMNIAFALLFSLSFFNAQISDQVRKLAKPLDTIAYAESEYITVGAEKSKVYEYFQKLAEAANNDELFYLAKNGSKSLKFYSSRELLKRNDKRFLEIYRFYTENPFSLPYMYGSEVSDEDIKQHLKQAMKTATEMLSLVEEWKNDESNNALENFENKQLRKFEEKYKNLTKNDLKFYWQEIGKIDSDKK